VQQINKIAIYTHILKINSICEWCGLVRDNPQIWQQHFPAIR